jgi:hypothetical protein
VNGKKMKQGEGASNRRGEALDQSTEGAEILLLDLAGFAAPKRTNQK